MIRVSDLKLNSGNPRHIQSHRIELLKRSITEFREMMELRPIIVDESDVVLGGNMRLQAIKSLGIKEIPDAWVKRAESLTEAQKREFIIKDNAGFGEWDWDLLANEWDDLPLADWGLDVPQFEAIAEDSEEVDAEPQIDKAAELNEKWKVKTGDLWQIGEHRLLCGDSTNKSDVADLMGGEKADITVTSPPYYNQRPEYSTFDSYDDFNRFLTAVILTVKEYAEPSSFIFAWNTGDNQPDCLPMIADQTTLIHSVGFTYLDTIIWRKAGAVYSIPRSAHIRTHNYYYPALSWEPIVIFRLGEMPKFDAKDVDRVSEFGTNVWEMTQVNGNVQDATGHPAMYPTELAQRVLMAYSRIGSKTLEPFAGSGTTLVACQNLKRKCYAIEISENYCAVILERMHAAFPELDIKKVDDGKTAN